MNKWNPDDFQNDISDDNNNDEGQERKFEWDFIHRAKDESEEEKKEKEERTESSSPNSRPVKQKRTKKSGNISWIIILIFVAFILFNSLYIVNEGQWVFVTRFGKIVHTSDEPGLKLHVPFIENYHLISSKMQEYNVNPSEVLTADKKAMIVDSYVLWRVEDPIRYIRTVSGSKNEVQKRIDASVYSNIKNIVGRKQRSDIITDEESSRDTLNQHITQAASDELTSYGVEVLRVEIRRYDLPSENLSAVYNRMISERQQMAASFKADGEYEAAKMRNETDKTYEILIGNAEATANRLSGEAEEQYIAILAEIYNKEEIADFYNFSLELDTLAAGLKGEKTIVLGPDSVLGQMLSGSYEGAGQNTAEAAEK